MGLGWVMEGVVAGVDGMSDAGKCPLYFFDLHSDLHHCCHLLQHCHHHHHRHANQQTGQYDHNQHNHPGHCLLWDSAVVPVWCGCSANVVVADGVAGVVGRGLKHLVVEVTVVEEAWLSVEASDTGIPQVMLHVPCLVLILDTENIEIQREH